MKATFLGTGTSVGVPVIGCDCKVCLSPDPRNNRLRSSLLLEHEKLHLVVDTPPDFREQALRFKMRRIDALLYTHAHADHILGLDDVRRFNTIQDEVIPAYADTTTIADLKRIFCYIQVEKIEGMYRPRIDFKAITGPFSFGDIDITPLHVLHGSSEVLGFMFTAGGKRLGYIPDCSSMPEKTVDLLKGVDVMILDALRFKQHKTHYTLEQSLATLDLIGAGRSFLVHMCHDIDHVETESRLPPGVRLSYDGLILEL